MRSVLDKLFELDVRSKALSDLRQKLAQGHKIVSSSGEGPAPSALELTLLPALSPTSLAYTRRQWKHR